MDNDRQTKNAASEGTGESHCWLCRMIGHKWVTRRKYSVDGVSMSDTVLWGCCVRCGEPTPDAIMDATSNDGDQK